METQHDCTKSYADILLDKRTCYYHDVNKFNYWNITEANKAFFVNRTASTACPFQGGMNQLWRNQLLALGIERDARQPYEHVHFSVVKHPGNHYLDKTLAEYTQLIASNPKFSVLTSLDVMRAAEATAGESLRPWIDWYRELYQL